MSQYTLDQLAHFNRCLFPDDFARDMQQIGQMDPDQAFLLKMDLRARVHRGQNLNVLDLYQDYAIPDPTFRDCLERVLLDFFKKDGG